jgi:hypothetical protein
MGLGGDHDAAPRCLDDVIAERLGHGVERQRPVDQCLDEFETAHGPLLRVVDDAEALAGSGLGHGRAPSRSAAPELNSTIIATRRAECHPISGYQEGHHAVHGCLRICFGQRDKTLIDRHRHDDPSAFGGLTGSDHSQQPCGLPGHVPEQDVCKPPPNRH